MHSYHHTVNSIHLLLTGCRLKLEILDNKLLKCDDKFQKCHHNLMKCDNTLIKRHVIFAFFKTTMLFLFKIPDLL